MYREKEYVSIIFFILCYVTSFHESKYRFSIQTTLLRGNFHTQDAMPRLTFFGEGGGRGVEGFKS